MCWRWTLGWCLALCAPTWAGPLVSPAGSHFLVPEPERGSFLVCSLAPPECLEIAGTLTGGAMARWSADGTQVGFKVVQELPDGARLQAPALLDVATGLLTLLADPVPAAGNPAFSADGHLAFTLGSTLTVLGRDRAQVGTAVLPSYANWIALSSDGSRVLYNDDADQILILEWSTGRQRRLSPSGIPSCRPILSPDGSQALISSISGELYVVGLESGHVSWLGPGDDPVWEPEGRAVIASERIIVRDRLEDIRLVRYGLDGSATVLATAPGLWPRQPSLALDGRSLFFVSETSRGLFLARLGSGSRLEAVQAVQLPTPRRRLTIPDLAALASPGWRKDLRAIQYIRGVPYHHQVYCTPAWFDGSGACGATSATMAIDYYDILADWDFLATTPFEHTSHFGAYVSEIYSYNGYTYDIWAGGGWGGHGFIWQDNGLGTKENMRVYISQHGLSSPAVDWSPSYEKVLDEVAARTPFVLLSSITTSGHYKTVVGYHQGMHTLYFNDPYGDKNQGYMNFNGAGASYDWPGYNNGYANLNTVWCYIYARGTPPEPAPGTIDDPIVISGFPFTDTNTTRSSGGSDDFDYYSCAPTVDERGREQVYTFTVATAGELAVEVECDHAVDIDIHLLTAPDPDYCLRRAHISFSEWIPPGTYWLTCDTYRESGVELMGDYTVSCTFTPDDTVIFSDGFESGDTSAWSETVPPSP